MAALVDVPDGVRGPALGPNVTSASLGWLGATALGGCMAQHGFAGSGPLAAGVAAVRVDRPPGAIAGEVRRGYYASAPVGWQAG